MTRSFYNVKVSITRKFLLMIFSVLEQCLHYTQKLSHRHIRSSGAGGQGGRLLSPPKVFCQCAFFSKSPLNVSFLKEVTKNVHENQYSTRVSQKKHNMSLLIGFYQVENIKL